MGWSRFGSEMGKEVVVSWEKGEADNELGLGGRGGRGYQPLNQAVISSVSNDAPVFLDRWCQRYKEASGGVVGG